jgi:hypothetical protein
VADGGDATARMIVEAHGHELGEYALSAASKVNMEHLLFTLVLAGGVFRHASPLLKDAVVAKVRWMSPDIAVVQSNCEPVVGAVLLALQNAGVGIGEGHLAHLKVTV